MNQFFQNKLHSINFQSLYVSVKSKNLWENILLGQVISLLICTTAVTSQVLAQYYSLNIPTAQNFVNYLLLATLFNCALYVKRKSFASSRYSTYTKYYIYDILRNRGLKYFVLALIDVEANYLIVKAYRYTTLTAIQLLDCLTIPVVMLLSILFLRVKYRMSHFLGVFICVFGVGFLIYSDRQQRQKSGQAKGEHDLLTNEGTLNKFFGDMLCIIAATLYGVSNVGQEFFVKRFDKYEFLAMIGTFGTIINGIQFLILETGELKLLRASLLLASGETESHYHHHKTYVFMLVSLFTVAMFGIYYCMATAMERTSALAVNLSILSADFYTLFIGIFLFHYKFNALFLLAFVLIINGVIVYNVLPTLWKPGGGALTHHSNHSNGNTENQNSAFSNQNFTESSGNNLTSLANENMVVLNNSNKETNLNLANNQNDGNVEPINSPTINDKAHLNPTVKFNQPNLGEPFRDTRNSNNQFTNIDFNA